MFRFQHVEYFWFLLLIPVIILVYLYFLGWRRRNLKKLGESSFVQELITGKINGRLTTKVTLVSLAAICLVTALANLQAGGHAEKTERKGLDVMFALDVSNSMLAQDISPNRLTKAKELIYRTLEQMKNDRSGLVVFAGNAYLQVPLTVDYGAMKMLLASVTPGMIPTQGTNFAEAIQMAGKSFSQKEKKNKVLVLISDGEDHDENAIDAAKAAATNGVIIYTIGIGSPRGSTILDPTTGQPKVDQQGNVVITKLNEAELRNIAEATGGRYQLLQNAGRVSENLVNSIAQLGTKNLGAVVYTDYDSYFQYFLGGGLLLFLIAFLLPDAKKIKPAVKKTFPQTVSSGKALSWLIPLLATGIVLACPRQLWAQQKEKQPGLDVKKAVNAGNDFYHQKQYDSAGTQYLKALKAQPNSFEGNFNLGDALYQSGQYDKARTALNNSLKSAKTKDNQAVAYHNIGNTFLEQKQWQAAADAFKKSLLLQPEDRDTKYNLAYAQEMLKQQQQKNKQNKKNNKDDKDKKNNKDKQQQQPKDSKDKQDQNQKKNDQQQKQQDQQPQQDAGQDKKEQQAQGRPSKLTKQQADNILNALNQEEQALHKKKKEQTGVPVPPGKDW